MKMGDTECTEAKAQVPRTPAGLARSQRANWKHGRYSAEAKENQRLFHQLLLDSLDMLRLFTDSSSLHGLLLHSFE